MSFCALLLQYRAEQDTSKRSADTSSTALPAAKRNSISAGVATSLEKSGQRNFVDVQMRQWSRAKSFLLTILTSCMFLRNTD